MKKLKEINGKYYRECKVVMLATDKIEGKMYSSMIAKEKGKLFNYSNPNYSYDKAIFQHLYFLSNEEIKEGDWCHNSKRNSIELGKYMMGTNEFIFCKKIIATTDTSLGLPQPSKSFIQAYIEAYNESNPIKWVNVEYDVSYEEDTSKSYTKDGGQPAIKIYQLKVDKNNYITITKVKDNWTREEVIRLCRSLIYMVNKAQALSNRLEIELKKQK